MAEIDCPAVAADKNIVEADLKCVRLTCDNALARADKTDAPYRRLSNTRFVYVYELMRRGTGAATADVEVASATYTYGIALFLALSLATRGWTRPKLVLAGLVIVWLSSAWGIGFDAVRQLAISPELASHLALGAAARTAIAFGYQLGSLLLPTLLPIALWLAFNPQVWRKTPGA